MSVPDRQRLVWTTELKLGVKNTSQPTTPSGPRGRRRGGVSGSNRGPHGSVRARRRDTRELEVLVMISALEYFRHYIDGPPVYLVTDHRNITWLGKVRGRSDRLGRWILRLSEFNALLTWRKGKYMHIADCMSQKLAARRGQDTRAGGYVCTEIRDALHGFKSG